MASNELFLTVALAILVAAALGGWMVLNGSAYTVSAVKESLLTDSPEPKALAVLKPTELQNFELTEKTTISHNVAV